MSKLFRSDKPDIDAMIQRSLEAPQEPSPDAVAIVNNLGRLLVGITNQLDLLIKLECNFIKRKDLAEQLKAAIAESDLMAQVAEAQETEDELEGQTSITDALEEVEE